MSTTAGVFSETLLLDSIVKAEAIQADDRINQQFKPQIEASKAYLAAQTMDTRLLETPDKDTVLKIWWENFCGLIGQECVPCEVGGPKGSTNAQTYTIDRCWEVPFSLDENDFTGNIADPAEHLAKQKLRAKVILAEYVTQQMIVALNSFVGINAFTGAPGVVSGADTFIGSSFWTPELVAYFLQVTKMNRFTNPSFLTGANLFQAYTLAQANAANADGKGANNMFSILNPFFDQWNVDTVNTPNLVSYLISKGSVAFASKAIYPANTMKDIGSNITAWSENNGFIPGLKEDWKFKKTCSNDRTLWDFTVGIKFGLYSNPTGCDLGNTGVLSFTCGTP